MLKKGYLSEMINGAKGCKNGKSAAKILYIDKNLQMSYNYIE